MGTNQPDLAPLSRDQYDSLLAAADTYRATLLVRLCGEVGLRPAEITRLQPRDIEAVRSDPPQYLLRVQPVDDAETDSSRLVYLPTGVERELTRYVHSNGIDDDEPIISVSPRRIQMLVSAVGKEARDRPEWAPRDPVSTRDLRRFFAHTALVDDEINPRIIKAVCGWGSFEALEPYLPEPTPDQIVDSFTPHTAEADTAGLLIAVTEALLRATTQPEIEAAVTETVVDAGFVFAWIDRPTTVTGKVDRTAVCGIDAAWVERIGSALESPTSEESVSTAHRSTPDDAEPTHDVTLTHSPAGPAAALLTVPLADGETCYGRLQIGYDHELIGSKTRKRLGLIGRQTGAAITAARRRNLVLSDRQVELEFRCRDEGAFFVQAADHLECQFTLDALIPVSTSTYRYYVFLENGHPDDVFGLETNGAVSDCRVIDRHREGWRLECLVSGDSPVAALTNAGTTVLEATADSDGARIIATCGAATELRPIVDGLQSAFPATELIGKRTVESKAQFPTEFRSAVIDRLTDRQQATLRAAYFAGYYDWPRSSTAEEVADAMGVSSPTLHSHLRKGQQELLRLCFETVGETDRSVSDAH